MSAQWDDYSEKQLDALLALDFAMPVHEGYALHRIGMRSSTIRSLVRRGLVRRTFYQEQAGLAGIPLLTLTQQGERVRRDWMRWCKSVGAKVGQLPPGAMSRAAEARP